MSSPVKAPCAFLVLGMLLLVCACADKQESPEKSDRVFALSDTMAKHIQLDTVSQEPVIQVLSLTAHVEADENKLFEIYPFVGGSVTRIKVELGDRVEKGEVLAVIKSGEIAEYERELSDAKSDVAVAQKNLSVQRDLLQSKLSTDREVLTAQRELSKAEADLRRIEEIFRIYSINANSEYIIKAPTAGVIIRKNINNDETLRADRSSSIFTIAELSEVWVIADVYENDISRVAPGLPVEIRAVAYPNAVINAQIDKVFNVLDPDTRTMSIRMRVPNSNGSLKPGMVATATISYQQPERMLAVKSSSIVFDAGKSFVVLYKDRHNISIRSVDVDNTVADVTYIKGGLNEGDVVVSKGQLFLYDALTD